MRCPSSVRRHVRFRRWLRTLNPFRLVCAHCGVHLSAGLKPYAWTAFHPIIGGGLSWLAWWVHTQGILDLREDWPWFAGAFVVVVFTTAWVIPWVFFDDAYKTK